MTISLAACVPKKSTKKVNQLKRRTGTQIDEAGGITKARARKKKQGHEKKKSGHEKKQHGGGEVKF